MFILWIAFFLFVIFRWKIIGPILGAKWMSLFDALLGILLAAMNFAQPSTTNAWFNYLLGTLCLLFGMLSYWVFMNLPAKAVKSNE